MTLGAIGDPGADLRFVLGGDLTEILRVLEHFSEEGAHLALHHLAGGGLVEGRAVGLDAVPAEVELAAAGQYLLLLLRPAQTGQQQECQHHKHALGHDRPFPSTEDDRDARSVRDGGQYPAPRHARQGSVRYPAEIVENVRGRQPT